MPLPPWEALRLSFLIHEWEIRASILSTSSCNPSEGGHELPLGLGSRAGLRTAFPTTSYVTSNKSGGHRWPPSLQSVREVRQMIGKELSAIKYQYSVEGE